MSRVRSLFAVVLSGLAVPAIAETTLPDPMVAAQLTAFTQARNAEIAASIATVNAARAALTRNAEIETVLAAYRQTQFARQRNAEIDASISAVSVERGREYVRELNARVDADRATAREAEFVRARNAEIDTAIAASQETAFARARNAEAEESIAAVNAQRILLDTGSITAATLVERPLRQLAAAFCWAVMLLSILLMGGGLIARGWRLRRGYLGVKLHLAHEAQSARRALSRMTDQIRSTGLRFASLDGSR